MIVAAVYASEIGRKEGHLDNLRGNWGDLFKLAWFSIGLSTRAPRTGNRIADSFIGQVYCILYTFTVCGIVIEEMEMKEGVKRGVELARKNFKAGVFGLLISDVVSTLGVLIALLGIAGFFALLPLLAIIFGLLAWVISIIGAIIFLFLTWFATMLISSLVTNVYYSLVYLNSLGEEGSPLLAYYSPLQLPLSQEELESVWLSRGGIVNLYENYLGVAIDWWERKVCGWKAQS